MGSIINTKNFQIIFLTDKFLMVGTWKVLFSFKVCMGFIQGQLCITCLISTYYVTIKLQQRNNQKHFLKGWRNRREIIKICSFKILCINKCTLKFSDFPRPLTKCDMYFKGCYLSWIQKIIILSFWLVNNF